MMLRDVIQSDCPAETRYVEAMRAFEAARETFEDARAEYAAELREALRGRLSGGQRMLIERELRDLERAAKEAVIG